MYRKSIRMLMNLILALQVFSLCVISSGLASDEHNETPTAPTPAFVKEKAEGLAAQSEKKILRFVNPGRLQSLNDLFLQLHPDVSFEYVDFDPSDTSEYILNENPIEEFYCDDPNIDIDIYILNVDDGLRRLIREGYVLDLSSSKNISDTHATYFPQVREALSANGKPMAVPFSFSLAGWDYDKKAWDALGLPDVPRSADEIVQLLGRWNQDIFLPPETVLYGNGGWGDIRIELLMDVLRMYVVQYGTSDAPLNFDTPGFRDVITRILNLPVLPYSRTASYPLLLCADRLYPEMSSLQDIDDMQTGDVKQNIDDRTAFDYEGTILTPMSFLEGEQAKVGADVGVVCIASDTENPELAMEYVAFIQDHQADIQEDLHAMLTADVREMDALGIQKETQTLYCDLVPSISLNIGALGEFQSTNYDGDKYLAIFLDAYDLLTLDDGSGVITDKLLALMKKDISPLIQKLNEYSLSSFAAQY